MTPREALEQFGTLYNGATPGRRGYQGATVHIDDECATLNTEYIDITDPAQIPLRVRVCQHCDPDHEVRMSPDYDVPAIEDHDDRPAWAPAEVADD